MGEASITIDVRGLKTIEASMVQALAGMDDLSVLMDRIGMAMETTTHERFEGESDPQGVPWVKSDFSRKRTPKTLTEDGHLDNSVTHLFSRFDTEIGSALVYARAHNEGWAEGNLPKRQFLGLGGDDEVTIVELAEEWLMERLAA